MKTRLAPAPLVLLLAVAAGTAAVWAPAVIALAVPAAIGLAALSLCCRAVAPPLDDPGLHRSLVRWTLAAFWVHLAIGMLIMSVLTLTMYFGPDALRYHETGRAIAESWRTAGATIELAGGKEGFYYMLAGLYWVLGPHWTAGLAVNAALAAALVPLMTDVTSRLFGMEAARRVAPLTLLLPGFLLWPSQLLREAGALFLIAVTLACAVRLLTQVRVLAVVVLVAALSVLFTFRGPVALVVAAGLIIGISFGRRQVVAGIGTGATVAGLIAVLVLGLGLGYSGFQATARTDLRQVNAVRLDYRQSGSGFGAEADISTPRTAVGFLPKAVPLFLFGPFPWQIHGIRQLPALFENAVWILLLPSAWAGVSVARRTARRGVLPLILPAAGLTIVLSLVIGNFGTLLRERTQVILLAVPFIALGLAERSERRSKRSPHAADGYRRSLQRTNA